MFRVKSLVLILGSGLAAASCGGGRMRSADPASYIDLAICSPGGEFTLESTNPYFPMTVGKKWVLEGGDERVEVTVLDETEVVAGVTTRVIEEREWEDGEVVEISLNFFAQASDGTICYLGEDVADFEDGQVVSRRGEWRAGEDGSRPGIIMPAHPSLGMRFQMEMDPGEAEDEGEIVKVGETIQVPAGTFTETIRVREYNPLDGEAGDKIFVSGVGMIIDENLELVSH